MAVSFGQVGQSLPSVHIYVHVYDMYTLLARYN